MRYRFAPFELDAGGYSLRRGGEPVPLEPRVLELLAFLVRHRERVVGKEELLREVWGGQFVTDAALSRGIYEARRALGDDGPQKRFITTVHGRGYRFAAVVEELSEEPAGTTLRVGTATSEPSTPLVALPAAPASTAAPPAAPTSASTPASTPAPGSTAEPPTPSSTAPLRRHALPFLAGLFALLMLAVAGVSWWSRSRGAGEQAAADRDAPAADPGASTLRRIALLPPATAEDDPELALLALSVGELMTARLGVLPGLLVRPPAFTGAASEDSPSLAALAREVQVDHLLTSHLARASAPGTATVQVTLHSFTPDGRTLSTPLGSFPLPLLSPGADVGEFVRVRDAIVTRLLERVAPALALPPDDPMAPHDPRAYRLYLLAQRRMDSSFCDGGGAAELLRQSLELDPQLAPAWMLLAVVRANQVWACGAAREEGYGEARAAAARVVELVPERVEPHLLEIIILVETGAIEEAFERVLVTRARFPDSILPRMSEAFVLRYAGFLGRAEQRLREALALDPLVLAADASGNVPNTLLYAGKVEEFLALVPATGTPYHRFYQGYGEMLLGRPERAREVLRPAFRDNPADLFARFAHALLAVLEGDHAAARAIVRQIALQRRELGAVDGEITYKQAQLLALAGDRDAALEQLALAVEQGFFNVPFLTSDPLLASLRADPSYARTVAAAGERHQAFGRRFGLRQ